MSRALTMRMVRIPAGSTTSQSRSPEATGATCCFPPLGFYQARAEVATLAGLVDDSLDPLAIKRLQGRRSYVAEGPNLEQGGRRGLGVGSLGDGDEVVLTEGPVDALHASPALLHELAEGIGPLRRVSEVLDALVRPVDQAYECAHGFSLPRAGIRPLWQPYARRDAIRKSASRREAMTPVC